MISLDANILVYAAGARHASAQQIVRSASNVHGALAEQAIFEFFHASTRKGKISVADAASAIRDLMQSFTVLYAPQTIVTDALALQSQHRLSIWDARLLAVCAAHGCDHLLSEDLQDGARYASVTVINPFNAANAALIGQLLT